MGIANVNVVWQFNNTTVGILQTTGTQSANLTFSPVNQSQEGSYTCTATLSIPDVPLQRMISQQYEFSKLSKFIIYLIINQSMYR